MPYQRWSPSGLSSSDYDGDYRRGDLTIVGSDQLLVRIDDVLTDTYGSATRYSIGSIGSVMMERAL